MRRTELLQEVRKMRFEEACGGWQERRLTQEEAARLPPSRRSSAPSLRRSSIGRNGGPPDRVADGVRGRSAGAGGATRFRGSSAAGG